MVNENNGVKDELRKVVDKWNKWNNLSLVDYVTPEEIGALKERAVDKLAGFYAPMLQKIDTKYHVDFIRFTQTGDASPEFMAYLDNEGADNGQVREVIDRMFEAQAEALREIVRGLKKGSLEKKVGK
ncbi:MAG TPA: hypothetical protein HA362_02425 [Nanoarchaeota archaeon]|nr:hypothetical protein [Nanoarchaeota archaeon]